MKRKNCSFNMILFFSILILVYSIPYTKGKSLGFSGSKKINKFKELWP